MKKRFLFLSIFSVAMMAARLQASSQEQVVVPDQAVASQQISVRVINNSSYAVGYAVVSPLGDFLGVPAQYRSFSRTFQFVRSWFGSSLPTTPSGHEFTVSLERGKTLAFYRIDLTRARENVTVAAAYGVSAAAAIAAATTVVVPAATTAVSSAAGAAAAATATATAAVTGSTAASLSVTSPATMLAVAAAISNVGTSVTPAFNWVQSNWPGDRLATPPQDGATIIIEDAPNGTISCRIDV